MKCVERTDYSQEKGERSCLLLSITGGGGNPFNRGTASWKSFKAGLKQRPETRDGSTWGIMLPRLRRHARKETTSTKTGGRGWGARTSRGTRLVKRRKGILERQPKDLQILEGILGKLTKEENENVNDFPEKKAPVSPREGRGC